MGTREYGEIYAFDDGAMPEFELRQLSGKLLPFYGLEDVTRLEVPDTASEEDIVRLCRQHCRSDHFILIDEYKRIPKSFMLAAAMCADSGRESANGYRIFKKQA